MRFSFKTFFNQTVKEGISVSKVDTAFAISDGEELMPLKSFEPTTFFDRLFKANEPNIGLLPPAVRWVSKDRKAVVFERPPSQYFIEVAWERKELAHSAPKKVFELPIPWTVYLAYFDAGYNPVKVFCYTRPGPITALQDEVFLLPMFNIYMDSHLCNPVVGTFEDHPETLSWGVQEVFNMVWNSGFNLDLMDAPKQACNLSAPCSHRRTNVRDALTGFLMNWADMSLSDVLTAKFPIPSVTPSGYDPPKKVTLEDAIATLYQRMLEQQATGPQETISNLINEFSF
jgi:hypothetical protein